MKDELSQNVIGKLLRGDDLVLYGEVNSNQLILKNHKLGAIFSEIGLETYNILSNISLVELDDVDMESLSELVRIFLSVFTNCKQIKYISELNDYQVFLDDIDYVMVNKDKLKHVFFLFRKMYCIPDKEDNKYDQMIEKNSEFKDILEEFKEFDNQIEKDKKHIVTFDSIVDSVSSKHQSYNLLNIWDLTVYQLMKTYYRLNKIDNYNHVMLGIYTGNINSEKIKQEEINWSIRI